MSRDIREQIDKIRNFNFNESVDKTFKNKILSSLNDKLNGYGKLPIEIRKLVNFNQKKTSVNESDKEKDNKSSNETKIPLQLKLKFQKFLKSAKGEEGEDAYLDRRRDAFIKELDGYSSMEVRTKLFKKLESEYGQVPGKFRAPFRWYK